MESSITFCFLYRPKNKYIRITKDEHFRLNDHYLSNAGIQAEKSCAYDLEDVDVVWLSILNGERALMGTYKFSCAFNLIMQERETQMRKANNPRGLLQYFLYYYARNQVT